VDQVVASLRRTVLVFALASCNELFDLQRTELAPELDDDDDNIPDRVDNCPGQRNADQGDEDGDSVGDVCDSCPLVPNELFQLADADGDAIGDDCDPRPTGASDCLILFDSFGAPEALLDHWSAPMTGVDAYAGSIEVHATAGVPLTLELRGLVGDTYDFQLLAHATLGAGERISMLTNAAAAASGHSCNALPDRVNVDVTGAPDQGNAIVPRNPVLDTLLLRMTTRDIDGQSLVACQVRYGVAVGRRVADVPLAPGVPGIQVEARTVRVDGFAVYRARGAEACPETVWR
jgi:hypothetical protein